jgi:hypothetical protein
MSPIALVLSKTNGFKSRWAVRGLLLLAACAFVWTVFDGLRTGSIRSGRGVWHRTVYRDNDPAEFWLAVIGNCVGCIVVVVILVGMFVIQ